MADRAVHEDREQRFRRVSRAFFALGVVTFIVASISIGKDAKANTTQLHLRPAVQISKAFPTFATATARPTALQAQHAGGMMEEDIPAVQMEAPLRVPTVSQSSSNLLTGGLLGAMVLFGGLAYIFRRQSTSKPSGGNDLMMLGPVSNYAMVSAAGEGSELLKKPELRQKPTVKAPAAPAYVTVEYQRKQAKALFDHFEALEQAALVKDSRKLGWTPGNEITNGRWVMFGWLVGMMTEYATGVSFVEQIKLTLNNLAIIDLD